MKELEFEPVIKAIDSASKAELNELAKIGSALDGIADGLKTTGGAESGGTDAGAGGMTIRRASRPRVKPDADGDNAGKNGKPQKSLIGAYSRSLVTHKGNSKANNRLKSGTGNSKATKITNETPVKDIDNAESGNIADETPVKVIHKQKKKPIKKTGSDNASNKADGTTIKAINTANRLPNRKSNSANGLPKKISQLTVTGTDPDDVVNSGNSKPPKTPKAISNGDATGNATSKANDSISDAMQEMKGFYRDQRGRLRRSNGRFANKEERASYSASEQANKDAEARRRGKASGDDENKASKGTFQKLVGVLSDIVTKERPASEDVADTAGSAVGNSYWKAAVEGYQLIDKTKTAFDENSEKIKGVFRKKDSGDNANDGDNTNAATNASTNASTNTNTNTATSTNIAPANNGRSLGLITQATPITNQAGASKVGLANPVTKNRKQTGAAGSVNAKTRATATATAKAAKEQLKQTKENHEEVIDVLNDILDETKGKGKKKGFLSSLVGGAVAAATGIGAGEAIAGGIGYKAYQKWKERRAKKKAAKEARKRGSVSDTADTDTGADLDIPDREGKRKPTKNSNNTTKRRRGRRGRKGRSLARAATRGNPTARGKVASSAATTAGANAANTGANAANAARSGANAANAANAGANAARSGASAANAATAGTKLGAKGIKVGAKVLGGALRAVPVIGQIASIGMAGMSFMDEEGQREAFGLNNGEKVGVQKKLAYAATDVLSLGGTLFDATNQIGKGLSAIGLDTIGQKLQEFDTDDAAKAIDNGITSLTDSLKGLFDSVKSKANAVSVAVTGKPIISMGNQNESLKNGVGEDVIDRRLAKYDADFEAAGKANGVSPALLKAIARQESGGDPYAVSKAGAVGLMQFKRGAAQDVGLTNRFDPQASIHGSAKYMARLLKRYNGDEATALAAYNYGMGNVDNARAKTGSKTFEGMYHALPTETKKYAPAILAARKRYAGEAVKPPATNLHEPMNSGRLQTATNNGATPVVTPEQKGTQSKAIASVPTVIPYTVDIGATEVAKTDSKDEKSSIDVVAKTDPILIASMNNGFSKLARAFESSGQQKKSVQTSQPVPRQRVPRGSGDSEIDSYMRDDY